MTSCSSSESITFLDLTCITADPSIQPRDGLNSNKLKEFVEILEGGGDLTPVTVFFDEDRVHWLSDGFHRYEAYRKADRSEIPAKVHQGTFKDAILCGIQSNAHHGLGLSLDERKNAARRLLLDPDWSKWSVNHIAKICSLTHRVVRNLKTESSQNLESSIQTKESKFSYPSSTEMLQSASLANSKIHSVTKLPEFDSSDHNPEMLQSASLANSKIHFVTEPTEFDSSDHNPEMLQTVSLDNSKIHFVTEPTEVSPTKLRASRNGKDYEMDVSRIGQWRKSILFNDDSSNVIDITSSTKTVYEALCPFIEKSPGTFCVHKAHCEEPLISDNQYEITIKFLTSGPSFAMFTIVRQMEGSSVFAQSVLNQALQLEQQSGTTHA